ncbi:MAG: terpene cyclase/mutase family protein [Planctomycetaceae bacterium]|nr:terpene cyclase/mutase family protein [Planctomycetaceae bacterium]
MSTIARHSDSWPAPVGGPQGPDSAAARAAGPTFWLDGDVLGCSCPDCGAPMSVRLWLRLADCWQCGTSLELTEAQEREVEQLLARREAQRTAAMRELASTPNRAPTQAPAPAAPVVAPQLALDVVAPPRRTIIAPPVAPQPSHRAARPWSSLLAWIASLLFHMLLVILLGLWMLRAPAEERLISLTSGFGLVAAAGEDEALQEVSIPLETPDPGDVNETPVDDDPFRQADSSIEQPSEHTEGTDPAQVEAPPEFLIQSGPGSILRGRGARERAELVKSDGGNRYTEEAVARGLRWLAMHQHADGHWGLDDFHRAGNCRGRCHNAGEHSDTAATALALLPFLGAGQTYRAGDYQEVVAAGLDWLCDAQANDGDLRGPGIGRMYGHALGTIVLCEAYELTRDNRLREPAQRGVDFIVAAQHRRGGWRYRPGEEGDTSVIGWQIMALRSAEMAYLSVPPETLTRSERYLERAQCDSEGGLYGYQPGFEPTPAMTAEGLLCRQYAGWSNKHPGIRKGVGALLERLPSSSSLEIYYWYYATQVMHHHGGRAWQTWNAAMRDTLVELQETRGHLAGSWAPGHDHMAAGGRLATTALAICTLEVYYRHLPLYREQAAER